uniref:Uncharacterized protein n=1 Tax=Arundo donax TaxID=35708 RepID=A0A0A9E3E5_ARUDO
MLCHKVLRLQGTVCAPPQSNAPAALLLCMAFLPLPPFPHQKNSPPSPTQEKETEIEGKCQQLVALSLGVEVFYKQESSFHISNQTLDLTQEVPHTSSS